MLNRRTFIGLAATAAIGSKLSWSKEKAMASLDHLLLGCSDLDAGIAFVEQRTGVKSAIGGVHPGRGTRNALLSLGERRYLEIIGPDPKQTEVEPYSLDLVNKIKSLKSPQLVDWAAHVSDMTGYAKHLRATGFKIVGPHPGQRKRPDGQTLHWKALGLQENMNGLLPFFIEWSADSIHPSKDAPSGCSLESFALEDKDPQALKLLLQQLELAADVRKGEKPRLVANIKGPKGVMELSS